MAPAGPAQLTAASVPRRRATVDHGRVDAASSGVRCLRSGPSVRHRGAGGPGRIVRVGGVGLDVLAAARALDTVQMGAVASARLRQGNSCGRSALSSPVSRSRPRRPSVRLPGPVIDLEDAEPEPGCRPVANGPGYRGTSRPARRGTGPPRGARGSQTGGGAQCRTTCLPSARTTARGDDQPSFVPKCQ
jgi:hypothetical protein